MTERRATITIDIDLAKYSKEAHMVTVQQIAKDLGAKAIEAFEAKGYTIRRASVNTMLHYVRHTQRTWLSRPPKGRSLKSL